MGTYKRFICEYCGYQEQRFPVGQGRVSSPYLAMYVCRNCKSVGSAWIRHPGEAARCSSCYDENVDILGPGTQTIPCPKCDEMATFEDLEGQWE